MVRVFVDLGIRPPEYYIVSAWWVEDDTTATCP